MACPFSSVSAEGIEALKARAENENTSKASAVWLRTVTKFCKAKKLDISFATCSTEEFNEFLCQFYFEVKPQKPDAEYCRNSY